VYHLTCVVLRSVACDQISRDLWLYCIQHNIWLSCSHIPGKQNAADEPSRIFNDRTEWSLCEQVFDSVCSMYGSPSIDLFASMLNAKCKNYCAWQADPGAIHIDAFTLDWDMFDCCYIFPPFSVLNRCVRKIRQDQAQAIVIAPVWPTQTWFPILMKMLTRKPVILPRKNFLFLPHQIKEHPLRRKLVLMACRVSGVYTENKDFLEQQPTLSCHHGEIPQSVNINAIFRDGFSIVIDNKLVDFQFL
jgi:hypothetical protein